MKDYLTTPPILQPSMQARPFILYTSTLAHALIALLDQQDEDSKEYLVYYIKQTLIDYETWYTIVEKQCLSLVFTTSNLCNYLLNVEIHVIRKFDPLKHIFTKIDLSRCLAKLVIVLTKFGFKFVSQKEIKG